VRLIVVLSRHSGTEAAVAQAQEFLRDEPDNPGFHEALGWVYFFAGDLEQSIANYAKAYLLRPGDVFPAWRNTEVYLRLDDPESARRWVEAAQQRGPGSQWAQAAQEVLDYFEGNLESFQFGPSGQPLSGRPGADRIQLLSQVLIRTGRHEDARQLLGAMLDWSGVSDGQLTSPLDANAAANLAYLLPSGPGRDRLLTRLQVFSDLMLENLPDDWGSWQLKARLAAVQGQRDEMLAALRNAVDLGLRGARMQSLDPVFSDFENDPAYRELILQLERLSREARERMADNPPPGLST
jgi:tetratricopeptide (TPR) repeat protein